MGTRFVMWLMGLTYEVRGEQHINRKKGGVIVINHQSGIDLAGWIKYYQIFFAKHFCHFLIYSYC